VRTSLVGASSFLILTASALAQSYGEGSSWSSTLRMYGPLLLLVIVWLAIWKGIGFGKGGYRKFISQNQEKMSQIEGHLGEISRQLERIASSLERSGR
jgi:hypothetical protein